MRTAHLHIEPRLRDAFKEWCAQNGISMRDQVEALIQREMDPRLGDSVVRALRALQREMSVEARQWEAESGEIAFQITPETRAAIAEALGVSHV